MSYIPGGNPLRRIPNITWPARSKQQWIEWFRNCDEKQVEWRALWFSVIRPSICRANNEPWVYLMGLWGKITYCPLLVLRQYFIEQFIPLTHGLDSLEVSFDNKSVTDKMRRLAHDWKNAEYKRLYLPVASESSTRSYKDWHRYRVKELVLPPEKDPHYPAGPDSLDELTHLKYEVSRLREGVELKEMGEKYELAKTAMSQELDQAQLKNKVNGLELAVRERENQVQNLEAEKEELLEEQKNIIVVWSLTMQQRAMFQDIFYQAQHNFMCCQYQLDEFLEKLSDMKDKFLDLGRGINGLIDAWDKSEDSWKDALARMRKGVAVARELNKHVELVYGEAYPTGPAGQRLINCLQNVISCLDFFIGLFDNDKAVVVY
ncbi:hypothetical protein COLO4_08519 [Corchorus olitorius]|uniref:Uncharacterized protein n=1 Tax=Corchorus olitorius TaxID=93759 RepID=A0A1R3KFK0_9ROSI|nr:hypothetical protein COLO4_08519 [Corchorus olitorius]